MAGLFQQFMTALGLGEVPKMPGLPELEQEALPLPAKSEGLSTTVFEGEAGEWAAHMKVPWKQRGDGHFDFDLRFCAGERPLVFEARNRESEGWAGALTEGFRAMRARVVERPGALAVFDGLVSGNYSNRLLPLRMESSGTLPAVASRETRLNEAVSPEETRILVNRGLMEELGGEKPVVGVGALWPVLQGVLLQVGQQIYPRDRFTERIDVTVRWAAVVIHVLYRGRRGGRLEATAAGEAFEKWTAERERMTREELPARHSLFRMLAELSFLLNDRALPSLLDTAKVVVRDHLDAGYLRLSLAELMPPTPGWLEAMPLEWRAKGELRTPKPEVARFGIIDREDLEAWGEVEKPLREIGYHLVGQLGMGQFGRVYEAVNLRTGNIPGRVAIKVDRIRKGRKKEAIEAAETIMQTAQGLSRSPHVIRVFDAGKLRKHRATYHVLQLVEGDTLDHLLGIAGEEHASIMRPTKGRQSPVQASTEFLRALSGSEGEAWRKRRKSYRFLRQPALNQLLDLLTSKVLWVEEVHALGFAVNDLKNGNVMLNRRGQFKGIDLDSYSPIFSSIDKMPDFFFLAVSVLQMIAKAAVWDRKMRSGDLRSLLGDLKETERFLRGTWAFGDLGVASGGRVETDEVVVFLARFIDDCRGGGFCNEPGRYERAIDRLIALRRRLSSEEMILE